MPVGNPTSVVGVRLTTETKERLSAYAEQHRWTMAMAAGYLIEDALKALDGPVAAASKPGPARKSSRAKRKAAG